MTTGRMVTGRSRTERGTRRIDTRTMWMWTGSRQAVGGPLTIFIALYPFLIGLLQEAPAGLELAINIHLYDLIGGCGAASLLIILRFALRGVPAGNVRSGLTLAGWLGVGCVGILLQNGVAAAFGPVPAAYLAAVPGSALATVALLFSFTCVATVIRENADIMRQLTYSRRDLEFLQDNLDDRIASAEGELRRDIDSTLAPVLEVLTARVSQLDDAAQPEQIADAVSLIQAAASDVVRPVSHDLAEGEVRRPLTFDASQAGQPSMRITFRQVLGRKMALDALVNLPLSVALLAAFLLPSYLFVGGGAALLLAGIVPLAAVTLVLAGLTRVTARVRCVPLLALGAGVVLEAALSALFALAVIIFRLPLAPELSLFFAFGAALILSATSVFCLLYDTRQFVVGRANLVNIELAQLVSRSRQELGIRQQQLARLVHGSVQSRLNAARLRLSRAQSMTPEVIHAVLADLAEARAELTALPGRYDTDVLSQLEEISDFWHGVCELTLELGPDAVQAMDRDPAASQCVIAVVSEAVNNAVKHALAPEVTVVILCNSEQSLAVEVRNASDRAAGDGSVPGLGSRILNQLTHAWSVTRESGETVLRAEIRLRAPALVPV